MQAVVVHEHGDLEQLRFEEVEIPKIAADEVLIEVKACGMNHLDIWVRRGVPGHTFPLPLIPGCDAAGIVKEVGAVVRHIKPGDRVVISPGVSCGVCQACRLGHDHLCRYFGIIGESRNGGEAEYIAIPGRNVLPIPDSLSFDEAAAVPLVFLTAWHMLVARAQMRPGDDVLIHAAGSGIGSAAIQIAKLWGARVITTVGSDEKADRAKALGADEVIKYRQTNFFDEVRRLTGRRGVDIVLDHVGVDTFERSLRCLTKGGRLVTCGSTSGPQVTIDLRPVFFKSLSILGSTMGSTGELLQILQLVAAGRLRPVIDRTLPLHEIAEGHRLMEDRAVFGKIILHP